jgi:hypothetical protein
MIQAKINQWYVRWFLWNCKVLDVFWDLKRTQKCAQGTNLCDFFRTIMWGSVVAVLSVAVWAYLLITIFVMPFVLFNFVSVAISVGILVALFAAALLVALMCTVLPDAVRAGYRKLTNTPAAAPNKPPGITHIVWTYLQGVKNRFCPTIRFDKDAE